MNLTKDDVERFKSKVRKTRKCWEWIGGKYENGYGQVSLRRKRPGRKTYLAHRISWMIANSKPIPKGMMVCHTCDNRGCVKPKHLYAGTGYQNNSDTVRRGRGNRRVGAQCSWSKLTEKNVKHILKSKKTNKEMAERYRLDPSTVSQIRSGLRWAYLHRKTV